MALRYLLLSFVLGLRVTLQSPTLQVNNRNNTNSPGWLVADLISAVWFPLGVFVASGCWLIFTVFHSVLGCGTPSVDKYCASLAPASWLP